MKNIIYLFALLLVFISCSKKKEDTPQPCTNCNTQPPPPVGGNNTVTAYINGQPWQDTIISDARISFNLLPGFRMFNLMALGSNQGIYLSVADTILSHVEKLDFVSYTFPPQGIR